MQRETPADVSPLTETCQSHKPLYWKSRCNHVIKMSFLHLVTEELSVCASFWKKHSGVCVDWSVFSQTFGDLLSKELESHAVHGTEEAVNAGPLSWLVMEGSSESSLEANIASVRQEQTDCLEGDGAIWKRFSLRLRFMSETYKTTLWLWPLE